MRLLKILSKPKKGQVLIMMVLIIFGVSSLVMIPLLNFMSTGVITNKKEGQNTQEVYAAEAGVRDAIWKIQRVVPGLPKTQSDLALIYAISGGVNGKTVNVTISWIDSVTYRVHSVAANPSTGHIGSIDSDIQIGNTGGIDLSAFTKFALTSPGTITTKNNDVINGDVWVPSLNSYSGVAPSGTINVAPVIGWPTALQLETYFSSQVDMTAPYSANTINISQSVQSGPLYVFTAGSPTKTYTITGTGQLNGSLYVIGNVSFDQNTNISLNGFTIFATGSVSTGTQSNVSGPGAIIAVGNISFQPHVTPTYIFVMSVGGAITLQPNGNFVGALAGDTTITLQPNCSVTWTAPGVGNLDMPGLFNVVQEIKTWTIH